MRSGTQRAGCIVGVIERAYVKRQAAASDAGTEVVADPFEKGNLFVQPTPPLFGESFPVGRSRRSPVRQSVEGFLDFFECEADPLARSDHGKSAERFPVEPSLTTGRSYTYDEPDVVVVTDRRCFDPRPLSNLADAKQVIRHDTDLFGESP